MKHQTRGPRGFGSSTTSKIPPYAQVWVDNDILQLYFTKWEVNPQEDLPIKCLGKKRNSRGDERGRMEGKRIKIPQPLRCVRKEGGLKRLKALRQQKRWITNNAEVREWDPQSHSCKRGILSKLLSEERAEVNPCRQVIHFYHLLQLQTSI